MTSRILFTATVSVLGLVSTAQQSRGQSLYTSVDEKKCWAPSKQVDARYKALGVEAQECKAPTGWKLFVVSSDECSWVDVQRGERTWTTEDEVVYNNQFGNFPNVGSGAVEWIIGAEGRPLSLVFRVTAQSTKQRAPLYANVARLFVISLRDDHPTFLGTARTNEEARALATKGSNTHITLPMLKTPKRPR